MQPDHGSARRIRKIRDERTSRDDPPNITPLVQAAAVVADQPKSVCSLWSNIRSQRAFQFHRMTNNSVGSIRADPAGSILTRVEFEVWSAEGWYTRKGGGGEFSRLREKTNAAAG